MKVKIYPFTVFVLVLALLSLVAAPVFAATDVQGEAGLTAGDHNCRFWGIISTAAPAAVIQDHLVDLPNSIENLSPANPDGWSVGYYPDGNSDPTVNRGFPRAIDDPNFDLAVTEAADETPRIAVSHVRNTSAGVTPASGDPHPFERVKDGRHWLMGHNGTIDKDVLLDLIRPDYFAANPPQYGSNQSEWIDSDLYQIFVLQTLEDFNFQVKPALGYVIRRLREEVGPGTSPSTEQFNFFLTDGTTLWAYREGNSTHTLYYLYDTTLTPYSAVASQYPSASQGSWVEMDNGDLITMQQDSPPVVEDIEVYFGGALLVDNYFDDSVDSASLRADSAGRDWYESRELEAELLTLDETVVGGNGSKKAAFEASATGNAYVSQEFGTPQAGVFAVQWDIYVDEILDIGDPDRAGWMLIGDNTDPTRIGPNSDDSERFVYMSFFRDGGGTTGTAELVARDRDDGWTAFTTVASGLNLDQWYTIKVVCDIPAGTYDVYVDDVFQSTVTSRHEKASVTHISFAQWDDGAGAFYVDNVYQVTDGTGHTLTMAVDPAGGGTTDPTVGAHTYPEDTTVTITAYANAGYEFDHWTGDVADPNAVSTTVLMDGDKTVTAHFSSVPVIFLADNDFEASADSADLRANGAGQDWYESRELEEELLTLDETLVGGNVSKKAAFEASATGNAYVSQEFGTPQAGVFSVQWDIYVDEILDIGDPDRAGWMLIGDDIDPTRTGPNSDDSERFVYMSFFRDGGGDTGTMDLVARDRDDGWTAFTTVAAGLNLDQWYTIRVVCDVPAGTYDVYVDDVLQGTVSSRHEKASVTHISFAQWDDGAGAFYVDDVYEVTGPTHTLTMAVDPAGGGTTDPTVGAHVYPEDATVTVSATPNAGYEFDYWEGDVADPNAASTTVVMDGDKTVTAHFAPLPAGYTLTMVASPAGGGTTDPPVGAHAYPEDEIVTITAYPNAGYEFDHWTGDVADPDSMTTTVVMDEDQTVTAHFAPTGVPTCVTIQRGAFGEVADSFIWEAYPTLGKPTDIRLRTGLYVHPRYGSGENRALIRFDLGFLPEDAVVQSATFGINQLSSGSGETVNIYRINQAWSEGGPTWNNFASNYDSSVTWASFVALGGLRTADVTNLVSAWVSGSWPNYGMMLINSPAQALDEFLSSDYSRNRPWLEICYVEAVNYTLTMAVDPTGGGTTDPTVGVHTYPEDEVVAITAYASAGYEFDHWIGDVADPNAASTTVTMDGDKTATAHFSPLPTTYELTMAVDPTEGGTTDPTVGVHTYPEDEVVAITAYASAGYEFDHWTGDVADPNSASTTVTMDGDKTVTAHFSLLPTTYELTMAVDPTAGGTTDPPVGVHTYPEDEIVSITATPNAGYEFDNWTGDVANPDSASTTVTMDGNKTITAHFSLVPVVFLADNDFNASVDSADLRANGPDQDWYESRGDDPSLLFLDETDVGGNGTKKAGFTASATGNAYVSQEFGTPQTGAFAVQWDIYVDEILDISGNPDRAGWMLVGDDSYSGGGPNANNSERFVYLGLYRDGGGTSGTMDLMARDRDDGWTSFTTVASGLNLDQWYTILVVCDLDADTYDVYVDGAFQATVSSRNAKASVTHISFAQWNDGAGAFYVDNVYEASGIAHTLTMAVDPTEGGTTDPTPGAYIYVEGTTVDITASSNAGYQFDHWTGDVANPDSASTTVTMDGNKTVTAHFSLIPTTYELTMAIDPTAGGTTDPSVGAHTYPEDEVVSITATPNAGYEFDHWTGDVANPDSASTTVTMDGNKTVTAHFALLPTTYELTMAVDPTAGGTTDPTVGVHTYPEDEVVAITAYASAGYEFDHWTGDVADPNSATTTVTMDGDKTVTAYFVPAGEPVCVTIQRGTFGEVEDGYIWEAYPTMNKFADVRLRTGLYTHPRYGSGETRSLLRFGLDFLPGGAVIQSATLGLMQRSPGSGETVNVYRIIADWNESDPPTWDFAGNYDGTIEGSFVSTGDWVTADVTGLVSDWAGGTPNYGLMLINGQAVDEYLSSDYRRNQPWLEVCYIAP